jgi:hypothetical protein
MRVAALGSEQFAVNQQAVFRSIRLSDRRTRRWAGSDI